ncbi:coiled-coil domain-containing protein 47 [Scaptodrosophila lebanonensis]|uniref:PAT complex subunit CCDC47 n=1 Tax=Drosophila lebanonensis TaxID=7225 RepID=A0A6J2U5T9_DROLE|nr:coiled-coil domain-containing protein 47 [Scaptodrosophila lebanonensis]
MRPIFTFFLLAIFCLAGQLSGASAADVDFQSTDDDFADFFDDEFVDATFDTMPSSEDAEARAATPGGANVEKAEPSRKAVLQDSDEEDGVVEDDDEFEHFQDEEEFEGYEGGEKPVATDQKTEPKLNIPNLPLHFRTHWDSYWMEMLMIAGLLAYFSNFFAGKAKNARLAQLWFSTHKALLDENFALVGDDGKQENESPGLMKESESLYTLWCSGRTCCEGMLVELKMIKRQDVVSLVAGLMRPQLDQVHIKIELTRGVMDAFVFAVGSKKTITKVFKEYADLSKFCSLVSKPEDRYNLPSGFGVLSEVPEATSAILESRVITALNKYQSYIDYLHISDQFSGLVQQEEGTTLKQPETKCMLLAGFNLPKHAEMETIKPLLLLIFYLMERLKTYRMSKEGKAKSDKNRLRVEEEFLKSTHAARAEAAAQRREDKRKQEKERVLAEEDPEKQRRWEQKEQKRQAKKNAPKMKRLAVKSL